MEEGDTNQLFAIVAFFRLGCGEILCAIFLVTVRSAYDCNCRDMIRLDVERMKGGVNCSSSRHSTIASWSFCHHIIHLFVHFIIIFFAALLLSVIIVIIVVGIIITAILHCHLFISSFLLLIV